MTSAIFQHIQKVFVGHSDRSLLIERGGQKLNHIPPKLLALYIGEITLAYEPVVIVVPATIVVKLVNHNTENRLARLVQMLTGEVLEGELLCLYLVHGGTAISCRADLVCIELLPPVERSGNIHRYENLTEELTVRCAATNEPGHKVFIIVTDCIALIRSTVMLLRVTDTFSVDDSTLATVNRRVAVGAFPAIEGISHSSDSVFPAPYLGFLKFNHRSFLLNSGSWLETGLPSDASSCPRKTRCSGYPPCSKVGLRRTHSRYLWSSHVRWWCIPRS